MKIIDYTLRRYIKHWNRAWIEWVYLYICDHNGISEIVFLRFCNKLGASYEGKLALVDLVEGKLIKVINECYYENK